jgi:hypothetical protein
MRLADVLAVPVRERNDLLTSAGLAQAFPTRSLENWRDVVRVTLTTLRREAFLTGDPQVIQLLRRAEALARGALAAGDLDDVEGMSGTEAESPVTCPVLNVGGRRVRTIATVMRFDTAAEVTTSELRVELMFPADAASDAALRALTETS